MPRGAYGGERQGIAGSVAASEGGRNRRGVERRGKLGVEELGRVAIVGAIESAQRGETGAAVPFADHAILIDGVPTIRDGATEPLGIGAGGEIVPSGIELVGLPQFVGEARDIGIYV